MSMHDMHTGLGHTCIHLHAGVVIADGDLASHNVEG